MYSVRIDGLKSVIRLVFHFRFYCPIMFISFDLCWIWLEDASEVAILGVETEVAKQGLCFSEFLPVCAHPQDYVHISIVWGEFSYTKHVLYSSCLYCFA